MTIPKKILTAFEKVGFLMLHDQHLPSIVKLIVGEHVAGSWWGHSKGHAIYNTSENFSELPDVLAVKLFAGKVTFVHSRHWPELVALGQSKSKWQIHQLTDEALSLLKFVEKSGEVRADKLNVEKFPDLKKSIQSLESRLLIWTCSEHTESGAHFRNLVSWERLKKSRNIKSSKNDASSIQKVFEELAVDTVECNLPTKTFPWGKKLKG